MPDTNIRLNDLLSRYISNSLSQNEENELFDLLNVANEGDVEELLLQLLESEEPLLNEERRQRILANVFSTPVSKQAPIPFIKRRIGRRWAVAASIALLLGAGYWFLLRGSEKTRDDPFSDSGLVESNDVKAPENNKAMITLADGRKVYLDQMTTGSLVKENGVSVVKIADGKIIYSQGPAAESHHLVYNTLSNPRGSKIIDMTLADGSHVWLNAGSSITYPVVFAGNERKVTVTGEAYFEVVHNANEPFYVSKGDMQIKVLGTHFNVNAYDDEKDIKVTLLKGSVKVLRFAADDQAVIIKPGQQAIIGNGQLSVQHNVDTDAVMAWRNGLFSFDQSDLESVMRQIARWYDLEIQYEGPLPDRKFGGDISRMDNVLKVLKVLEESQVKFRIEGKKVVVAGR